MVNVECKSMSHVDDWCTLYFCYFSPNDIVGHIPKQFCAMVWFSPFTCVPPWILDLSPKYTYMNSTLFCIPRQQRQNEVTVSQFASLKIYRVRLEDSRSLSHPTASFSHTLYKKLSLSISGGFFQKPGGSSQDQTALNKGFLCRELIQTTPHEIPFLPQ